MIVLDSRKFHLRFKTLCDPVAGSLGPIKIVNVARFAKAIRGVLRRNIPLRSAKQFVTYHEFLNCGGAQKRRKVVRVQMPLVVRLAVGGLLVESHGVWESCLEQIVVTNGDAAHDVAQEVPLFPAELIDRSEMALAQHQRFEWPNGPEGHDHGKCFVLADDPLVQLKLQLQVIAEKARMFFSAINLLCVTFENLRGKNRSVTVTLGVKHACDILLLQITPPAKYSCRIGKARVARLPGRF